MPSARRVGPSAEGSELWQSIATGGRLEPAEGEWLHTNGAGAYSMSTLALMHTRRFHGLLVAALEPPVERHVILSHADTTVQVGKRAFTLSTHQFPDVAPTLGYRQLELFAQDPLPRWVYRLAKGRLERRLCLVRGKNTVVLSYSWSGPTRALLTLKPLLSMRPLHELRKEHGGILQRVTLRKHEVKIQPVAELPEVTFVHDGMFVGSPDWWRRFEYPEDMRRHVNYEEDLWTPGTFELALEPGETRYLTVSAGAVPLGTPKEWMADAAAAVQAADPGQDRSIAVRSLSIAAEQYRVPLASRPATIAGYPWLGVSARDTLIAMPGLYFASGQYAEARAVIRTLLSCRQDGLLSSQLVEQSAPSPSVSVDGSLWLFQVAKSFAEHWGARDAFLQKELYPALVDVFERLGAGSQGLVWLTPEGLLVNRGDQWPLTWMDSRVNGKSVTPRSGLAIELQALWFSALGILEALATDLGESAMVQRVRERSVGFRAAFQTVFCDALSASHPKDWVSADGSEYSDALRPNALLALDVAPELFSASQANLILERAKEQLLTPVGLRTLEPSSPQYLGFYEGGMDQRRAAYHQGVAWVYLLGAYARVSLRLRPDDFELKMDLKGMLIEASSFGPVVGQVPQVAGGDAPHGAGGCPAQAWSVAELLRTLRIDLEL